MICFRGKDLELLLDTKPWSVLPPHTPLNVIPRNGEWREHILDQLSGIQRCHSKAYTHLPCLRYAVSKEIENPDICMDCGTFHYKPGNNSSHRCKPNFETLDSSYPSKQKICMQVEKLNQYGKPMVFSPYCHWHFVLDGGHFAATFTNHWRQYKVLEWTKPGQDPVYEVMTMPEHNIFRIQGLERKTTIGSDYAFPEQEILQQPRETGSDWLVRQCKMDIKYPRHRYYKTVKHSANGRG